jgi:hypothetical protein
MAHFVKPQRYEDCLDLVRTLDRRFLAMRRKRGQRHADHDGAQASAGIRAHTQRVRADTRAMRSFLNLMRNASRRKDHDVSRRCADSFTQLLEQSLVRSADTLFGSTGMDPRTNVG